MSMAKKSVGKVDGAAPVQKKSMGKMDKKTGAAPVSSPMMKKGGKMGKKMC